MENLKVKPVIVPHKWNALSNQVTDSKSLLMETPTDKEMHSSNKKNGVSSQLE